VTANGRNGKNGKNGRNGRNGNESAPSAKLKPRAAAKSLMEVS
jgi:hypothetical protein